ncbi:MAG: hypothetical protein J5706_02545, partial [Elusimicrobiales bacterium]|nr:hypothetical protein [Elusimicrobiales bacterium]
DKKNNKMDKTGKLLPPPVKFFIKFLDFVHGIPLLTPDNIIYKLYQKRHSCFTGMPFLLQLH